MREFLISSLFLFLLVLPSSYKASDSPEFTCPIEIVDNRPFVKVKINNQPYNFVLDSGSSGVLIDSDIAQKLNLNLQNPSQTSGAGSNSATVWQTSVESLKIADKEFKDMSFRAISLKQIKEGLNLPYLDGIIGYSFLRNYAVQIDYPKKIARFLSAYKGANPVSFTFYGSIPKIKVRADKQETEMFLDTGDRSQLTLLNNFADKLGYEFSEEKITGYGVGGAVYAKTFTLKSLQFGNVKQENVLARTPTRPSGAFSRGDIDGSIGGGILKNYKLTIDYKDNLIYFE